MPTPTAIMADVASLMNDTARDDYTDAAVLPYFNMALRILQETYELNNIPITDETSDILIVPKGVDVISFQGTNPTLPTDLVEIQQLWESPSGLNEFQPMDRQEYIPHYLEDGQAISQFLIWAWKNNSINLIAANQAIDLKIDYVKSLFPTITANDVANDIGVRFVNIYSYMMFQTAAICAMFIAENPERAEALEKEADDALERSMGISTKGKQSIVYRRRPFRSAYKMRRTLV